MTRRELARRLDRLESSGRRECRCPRRGPDPEVDTDEVDPNGTYLLSRCDACGGFFRLEIIELVVESPEPQHGSE